MERKTLFLFSLFALLLFFFFVSPISSSEDGGADDAVIRQVVGDGDGDAHLLGVEHHFAAFKRRFEKVYSTQEEHDYRFAVFKANMRRARRHQRMDPSAVHGITRFSDMTESEFRNNVLGLRGVRLPSDANKAPILPTNDLPSDFDWRDHGAVTPVKNQCDPDEPGSCDSGCNGGLMNSAFEYILKSGGIMREEDYPYKGSDRGTCKFDKTKIAASVANFSVVSLDEDQIAANLVKNGPLAVAINAVFMQTYIGGVSCPYICSRRLDHGVLLVGYGSGGYSPIRMKEKPYWIIKNSWGGNWGENGYYKICRGRNICGVDTMVSSVAAVHTTAH
ncbi:Cysteine protease rd19a [Stylosanthes scabra]|uniref:Cysteine protease rd19a n=1 Tax=Stylosanthes scabra TaxID=79078 RepID=A0ABU6VNC1_9FABA|nr:Cysteine protease rd19a [Stylosanthes scabra]